ncbi:hypothetical protein NM688_g2843 [Phlebia brevispora]|uniref:Uncharacterized protein n=1 Tax=Phlebia brevispora TaxID=194682 RepID=A0ACC1T7P1_9APHY|nr:hypothetical protein NM688_g2843 [Phlebia brevispora]
MIFYLVFRIISAVFVFLYPGYASYKTLSQRPASEEDLERWLMYWSVLGCVVGVEYVAEWVVCWLPFYYPLKTLFLLYLALPQTAGSSWLYATRLQPFFAAHESEIDSALTRLKRFAYNYIQRLLRSAWNHLSASLGQTPSAEPRTDAFDEGGISGDAAVHSSAPPTLSNPASGPMQLVQTFWRTYGPAVVAAGSNLLQQSQAGAAQAMHTPPASRIHSSQSVMERRKQLEAELAALPPASAEPYDVSPPAIPIPSADVRSRTSSSSSSLRERSGSGNGKSTFEEIEVPSDVEPDAPLLSKEKPMEERHTGWFGWGRSNSGQSYERWIDIILEYNHPDSLNWLVYTSLLQVLTLTTHRLAAGMMVSRRQYFPFPSLYCMSIPESHDRAYPLAHRRRFKTLCHASSRMPYGSKSINRGLTFCSVEILSYSVLSWIEARLSHQKLSMIPGQLLRFPKTVVWRQCFQWGHEADIFRGRAVGSQLLSANVVDGERVPRFLKVNGTPINATRLSTHAHATRRVHMSASWASTRRFLVLSEPSRRWVSLYMPVTFHSFQDASNLPSNVDTVIHLLRGPLLDVERIASLPCLTPIASEQLQHILVRPRAEGVMNEKLLNVANLVLMMSAGIKELTHRGDERGLRPTKPLWYTLLRTIARCCYTDAEIIGEASFVYPKGFRGEQGVASMLVTFPAEASLVASNLDTQDKDLLSDIPPTCSPDAAQRLDPIACYSSPTESGVGDESSTDDSDEDEDYENDHHTEDSSYDEDENHPIFSAVPNPWRPKPDEAELFFGLDHVDEYEPSEEKWLDLPLDAHVLAGRRAWPFVSFPIVCIAEAEEIVPLLSSAVCQRATWGIDVPVIGFEMSKFDSIVHVYIGWFDSYEGTEHMPSIHILRQDEEASKHLPSLLSCPGFFDLSNPQSALELAHFVLCLDYQFEALRDELPSRRLQNLRWRSDDVNAAWAKDVEGWRTSVDQSDGSSTSDSSYPHTPSPRREDDSDMAPKGGSRLKNPSQSGNSSHAGTQDAHEEANTEVSGTTALSASRFAEADVTDIGGNSSIVTWMLHRWTFTVAKVKLPETSSSSEPPDFQRMVDIYDDVSGFKWIKEWETEADLPNVDTCVMRYRKELFSAYDALKTKTNYEAAFLDTEHANLLQSRLSLLFNSVDGAYTREARKFNKLEAECRHDWDALLSNFYVGDGSNRATSEDVYLERKLSLPLNTLSRQVKSDDHPEHTVRLRNVLAGWQHYNLAVLEYVTTQGSQDVLFRQQCSEAWSAAGNLYKDFLGFNVDLDPSWLRSVVQAQAKAEPGASTCDAILVTSVPMSIEKGTRTKMSEAYKQVRLATIEKDSNPPEFKVSSNDRQTASKVHGSTKSAGRGAKSASRGTKDAGTNTKGAGDSQDAGGDPQRSRVPVATNPNPLYHYPLRVVEDDPVHKVVFMGTPQVNSSGTSSDAAGTPATAPSRETLPNLDTLNIFLPQLVVEYKKPDQSERRALNQARMYCVASVSYLAAIGIKMYPVFALAAHGTLGNLIMTWTSDNDITYIMERNIRKFDISSPLSAFHFASVLLRVRARDRQLRALFKEHEDEFREKLASGNYVKWVMPQRKPKPAAPETPLATVHENDEQVHNVTNMLQSAHIG